MTWTRWVGWLVGFCEETHSHSFTGTFKKKKVRSELFEAKVFLIWKILHVNPSKLLRFVVRNYQHRPPPRWVSPWIASWRRRLHNWTFFCITCTDHTLTVGLKIIILYIAFPTKKSPNRRRFKFARLQIAKPFISNIVSYEQNKCVGLVCGVFFGKIDRLLWCDLYFSASASDQIFFNLKIFPFEKNVFPKVFWF